MIDMKLLQTLGNLAARHIMGKYPNLDIRFLAIKDGKEVRVAIVNKGEKSGLTARLFDLQPVTELDATATKTLSENLEREIEHAAKEFMGLWP